jgi:transposase
MVYSTEVRWLERELSDIDNNLDRAVRESPLRRVKDDILKSVPGIGPVGSFTLLSQLPELGQLNRDSGTLAGRRTV